MGKNMGKGGKNRKRGTNKNEDVKRELVLKEEGQEYAQIIKTLGNNRLEVLCANGQKAIGVIRGAIRRKMWICVGDIVLVGLRDFEEGKVDILSRYAPEEAKQLIKDKHIPPSMTPNDDDDRANGRVDFVNESSDSDDEDDDGIPGDAAAAGTKIIAPQRRVNINLAPSDDEEEGKVDVDAI